MKGGDISNIVAPYVAFDFDTLLFLPVNSGWKAKVKEKIAPMWSVDYYKVVPKARETMMTLMNAMYNIMVVYMGPHRMWKQKMFLLNYHNIPFTVLNCMDGLKDFNESIVRNDEVLEYFSMSQYAVDHCGPKAKLFDNWDSFLIEKAKMEVNKDTIVGVSGNVFQPLKLI